MTKENLDLNNVLNRIEEKLKKWQKTKYTYLDLKIYAFKEILSKTHVDSIKKDRIQKLNKDYSTLSAVDEYIKELNLCKIEIEKRIKREEIQQEDLTEKGEAILANTNTFYKQEFKKYEDFLLKNKFITKSDSIHSVKVAGFIKDLYLKIHSFNQQNDIHMGDIEYLENYVLPEIIGIQNILTDSIKINSLKEKLLAGIPLLKAQALLQKESDLTDLGLDSDKIKHALSLFNFISNLDNLDKAQTFESILNLFREGNEKIYAELPQGEFKNAYNLFSNAVDKYTLIDTKNQKIDVDVASFLVELENYYDKNDTSNWGFYLGIGINQNIILGETAILGSEKSVGLASEKLGVSYKILDFKRISDYTNTVPSDIYLSKQSPFINEWYTMVYGSGLLYTVANTTTDQNFDYAQFGVGTGIRFYNALDFNVTFSLSLIHISEPTRPY